MRKLLAAALAVSWLISLMLPVVVTGPLPDEVWPGYAVLLLGPLAVMVMQFAWFANLLLVPALILIARERPPLGPSIAVAVVLALLALNALTWDRVYGDNTDAMIQSHGSGYYLWLGTMLAAAAALVARAVAARKEEPVSAGQVEAV